MTKELVSFQVGTHHLNDNPHLNYQLNRTIMWSGGSLDELRPVAARIKDHCSWENELISLGQRALSEGRMVQAIAYYRMAEFFMFEGNPRKLEIYRKARTLFYNHYAQLFEDGTIVRKSIPCENGRLPIWFSLPENKPAKDVILLHGGNDSYIEEFLPVILYLRQNGFAVYLFEGPGQGEVLREQGIPFTPEWEKPVRKILDEFNLDDVTIVGISLGGMLAPRAAAYEKRIKRVVAWSIFPNFLDILVATRKKSLQKIVRLLLSLKAKPLINLILKRQMRKDPLAKWGIEHGMYNLGAKSGYDYLVKADRFQINNVAHLIDQDFLLLGASRDHFIPVEFYKAEIDQLINVHSMTYRLFTAKESAENHCTAGNTKLALDTIMNWIEFVKAHSPNPHLARRADRQLHIADGMIVNDANGRGS
ncbi:MAG: lysophospholipase [Chloroflexi bacterium RBG_16_52_11]|nr:MAG: lysophospholipase [Chloroflexi bacterium RBG_16_52_11]